MTRDLSPLAGPLPAEFPRTSALVSDASMHAWTPENAVVQFLAVFVDRLYIEHTKPADQFTYFSLRRNRNVAFSPTQWVMFFCVAIDTAAPSAATQEAMSVVADFMAPVVPYRRLLMDALSVLAPFVHSALRLMRQLASSGTRMLHPLPLLHSREVRAAFAESLRHCAGSETRGKALVVDAAQAYLQTVDACVERRRFLLPESSVGTCESRAHAITVQGANDEALLERRPMDAAALTTFAATCFHGAHVYTVKRRKSTSDREATVHAATLYASFCEAAEWAMRYLGVNLRSARLHPSQAMLLTDVASIADEAAGAGLVRVVHDRWADAITRLVGIVRYSSFHVNEWRTSIVPVLLWAYRAAGRGVVVPLVRVATERLVLSAATSWLLLGGAFAELRPKRRFSHIEQFARLCSASSNSDGSQLSDTESLLRRLCRFGAYLEDEGRAGASHWLPVNVASVVAGSMHASGNPVLRLIADALTDSLLPHTPQNNRASAPPAIRISPASVDAIYTYCLSDDSLSTLAIDVVSEMRSPRTDALVCAQYSTSVPAVTKVAIIATPKNNPSHGSADTDPLRSLAALLTECELLWTGTLVNVDRMWRGMTPAPVGVSLLSSFSAISSHATTPKLLVPQTFVCARVAGANKDAWPAFVRILGREAGFRVDVHDLDGVLFVLPPSSRAVAHLMDGVTTYVLPVRPAWARDPGSATYEEPAWLRSVILAPVLRRAASLPESENSPLESNDELMSRVERSEFREYLENCTDVTQLNSDAHRRLLSLAKTDAVHKHNADDDGGRAMKRRMTIGDTGEVTN